MDMNMYIQYIHIHVYVKYMYICINILHIYNVYVCVYNPNTYKATCVLAKHVRFAGTRAFCRKSAHHVRFAGTTWAKPAERASWQERYLEEVDQL